jgi:translation initiation factor 5A
MHSIKKGSYIVVEGAPCRVTDIQMSAPGKHGHAKARVTAVGILDNKKRVFVKPGDAKVDVPIINKRQAQVISIKTNTQTIDGKTITEHVANVMDLESYETFDMEIPEELVNKVVEGSQVLYWEVMGKKIMQRIA